MKANELMIGDLVLYGKRYAIIKRIEYSRVTLLCGDELDDETYDNIESIPLTSEILDDNFSSNPHWWFLGCTDVKLQIYKNGSFYTLYIAKKGVDVSLKIKYVHQLQHALRLCGIEKEIEL